ncbi:MAG TPA: sigma factor-like helix-turn-helix DNA-binding protein [Candidatus Saccharimonadales bacterium]|nr:sigma factor-like helix-turn-helix DNA-binding protein [Candidatus Saccharimonadales bacterium]
MAESQQAQPRLDTEQFVQDILTSIEREREREIVARRFGLFDRKETLEQIGELLGITRERVRQLEKSVIARLKATAEQGQLPHVQTVEAALLEQLHTMGEAARVSDLSSRLTAENTRTDQSRIAFLAELCPSLVVIEDNDHYYHSVGTRATHDEKAMKAHVIKIVDVIKKMGEPALISDIAKAAGIEPVDQARALASISKGLATLNNRWGLVKWPMVNPKNIRDKIYVILKEQGKHMHFNEIADTIKKSDFKRKDVTTQAIHNELIKDKRFVLIGRGIYALKEWGYKKGTVADIISEVLREASEPLHRDEIVKRVLKSRFVKETTILLNLQGKSQFKRVAKATYTLNEESQGQ